MTDVDRLLLEYRQRQQQEAEQARTKLLQTCQKYGVANLVVEFDGCGDEGTIFPNNENPEIDEAVQDFAYYLLEQHYPGWEINEGSQGTITIDINCGSVRVDFGSREEQVAWSHQVVRL